ncbi:MAG: hypothetical protein ACI9G6_002696, partial [Limisphaerales bacterium]
PSYKTASIPFGILAVLLSGREGLPLKPFVAPAPSP